ncbi:GntR family transcriptional regulator [Williamsia sterculiae]|uniref:Transcriptional regulator, GntR family n=1 Tax=Williamsia sterculiae TaxID=1344003 RepID=A0A1N7GI77_9NOCA|nr:GntR family transcriptional regulator [Williamsia sterculiae]SIS12250.1 transcriptional regulator, GntR family [Williamsia sterculiae]
MTPSGTATTQPRNGITVSRSDGSSGRPLRESIRERIYARIVSGTYKPGDRIVERDVAADFGVSRLPVREALRMLHTEGLVEMLPTRGVIVRQLSETDVADLFDVREALERLAFRRAAEKATKRDIARLGRLRVRARRAVAACDEAGLHESNEQFHDMINVFAGNALLVEILAPLEGRLHWIFRQNEDPQRLWDEHEELLDAITAHDAERAERLAVEHVQSNRTHVMNYLFGER